MFLNITLLFTGNLLTDKKVLNVLNKLEFAATALFNDMYCKTTTLTLLRLQKQFYYRCQVDTHEGTG